MNQVNETAYLKSKLLDLYAQAVRTKGSLINKDHHIGEYAMMDIMGVIADSLEQIDDYEERNQA